MRRVSIITLAVVFTLFTLGFATATQDVTLVSLAAASIESGGNPSGDLSTSIPSPGSDFTNPTGHGTLNWTVNGTGTLKAKVNPLPTQGDLKVEVDPTAASSPVGTAAPKSDTITLATGDTTITGTTIKNEALTGVATNYTWDISVVDGVVSSETLTVTFTLTAS